MDTRGGLHDGLVRGVVQSQERVGERSSSVDDALSDDDARRVCVCVRER